MAALFEELPAPPRPAMTPDQRYRRSRRFAVVLNWFVLVYSILHKFVLPLYVSIARSATFTVLDWWWVYHVALALLLLRKTWDDLWLRLFLLFGIGGAACQILVSFREKNWHSVSLWVTSASTLWVVFFLLAKMRWRFPSDWHLKKLALKAASVSLGFFVQFALFGFTLTVEKTARLTKTETVVEKMPLLSDVNACGTSGFALPLVAGKIQLPLLRTLNGVSIKDCGFPGAMAHFDGQKPLVVTNDTSGYMNVKLYLPFEGRWRPFQNMPLPPGLKHELAPQALEGQRVVLMASDADPKKGLILLLADPEALPEVVESLVKEGQTQVQVDRRGFSFF